MSQTGIRAQEENLNRRLIPVAVLSLLITAFAVPATAAAPPGEEVTDTWIVTLDPDAPAAEHAFGLAAQNGGQVEHVYHLVLNGFSFRGSAQAADAIASNPNVLRVEHTRVLQAAEVGPNGVFRIDGWAAHGAGHDGRMANGTPVRIAILDTGIMPNHVDLAPNLKPAEGKNCTNLGAAPNDGHGHGTHVSGTAAASFNGEGVVGVATDASLAAVKVLDDFGFGTDAQIICGLDHVLALAGDGTPTVVNMSLGETHAEGAGCASSALHQSICNLVAGQVTVVAAAGNNAVDAGNFFPAAYPEVIATSAFSDLDGSRSFAGCGFWIDIFNQCDDSLASFTNFGAVIDVAAPGVRVYSTTSDGAWGLNSGTSMASPHVAGVAALVLAADPTLTPSEVRDILRSTGECPDGAVANAATCAGHGQWQMSDVFAGTFPDPDGIPEPLVNALRAADTAAAGAGGGDTAPLASISEPTDGATVSGMVSIEISASDAEDAEGSLVVEWSVDGSTWSPTTWSGTAYDGSWESTLLPDGDAVVEARATDSGSNTTNATPVTVTVDNVDEAPTASISAPTDGATVSGTVSIEISASDPEDAEASLQVAWRLAGGSWAAATWNGSAYVAPWDSTSAADGPASIEARATDSASNVTAATPIGVTVNNSSPLSFIDEYANSESSTFGTVAGSYVDTHALGGGIEAISEEESSGKPSNRTSRLSHDWIVPVTGGDVVTFLVDAAASASGDGDAFVFAYSTDGSTFTDMVTIDSSTTTYESYVLPPSIAGDVTIRVTDTNRDRGSSPLDTLWVDHLYIRSESPAPGTAPVAPSGVIATGTAMDMINLTWTDNAGGLAAFEIQRRVAGSGMWEFIGATPAETTFLTDAGLAGGTTYDYRVRAYSAEGTSAWATASGTTLAASAIDLEATGYKVKGVQHVDLSWTGGTIPYDIYRDDTLIQTVAGPTYTDNLGVKGGGSYTYRVCEAGSMVCSSTVQVTF